MKSLKEIATIVLESRKHSSAIMQGRMQEALGSDGYATALERRWLVPDRESGYLQVTNLESLVKDMQRESMVDAKAPEAPVDVMAACRAVAESHAYRTKGGYIQEIAAPGTGKPAPVLQMSNTPSPLARPNTVGAATDAPTNVGDDVTVVENGEAYTGKVKSMANGRYRISFGGSTKPADRDYMDQEIKRVSVQA